jgi:uncharacterized membrane-anchored protein YjiN (DUF445 family)
MTHAPMTHAKPARLRRMQALNLTLLGISLALLAVSVRYQTLWPGLRWLRAFAEAAAIGAIADWYAVVALFRHPLGIPIPHTAIVPRNQRNIGDSLGQFVAQNLLTPDTIVAKLERLQTAKQLAAWLVEPVNAAACADSVTALLPAMLRAPEDSDLQRLFRTTVAPRLMALDAARLAQQFTALLLDTGLHSALLDRALALLDGWLLANEALIRERFAEASRYTPAFVDGYIVRKFLEGVRTLIHDVSVDAAHPLRESFERSLRDWSLTLSESAEQRAAAQGWLRSAINAVAGDRDLQRLREALAVRAAADLARPDSVLRQTGTALVIALAQGVARDPAILQRLEGSWLRLVRSLAARHRGQVAALIAEVVKGWDADEVGRKIELAIGPDLQFIRINGALVGGIVGLLLYAGTLVVGR